MCWQKKPEEKAQPGKPHDMSNEELCGQIAAGRKELLDTLIENNEGLVRKKAGLVFSCCRLYDDPRGITFDDLLQAGRMALAKAAYFYDSGKGASFITYAGKAIYNKMLDMVDEADRKYGYVHAKALKNSEEDFDEEYNVPPSVSTVCLEDVVETEDGMISNAEIYSDPSIPGTENFVIRMEERKHLVRCFNMLSDREKIFLLYRYGCYENDAHSLRETARNFHLSETFAREIEAEAIGKLRMLMTKATY